MERIFAWGLVLSGAGIIALCKSEPRTSQWFNRDSQIFPCLKRSCCKKRDKYLKSSCLSARKNFKWRSDHDTIVTIHNLNTSMQCLAHAWNVSIQEKVKLHFYNLSFSYFYADILAKSKRLRLRCVTYNLSKAFIALQYSRYSKRYLETGL